MFRDLKERVFTQSFNMCLVSPGSMRHDTAVSLCRLTLGNICGSRALAFAVPTYLPRTLRQQNAPRKDPSDSERQEVSGRREARTEIWSELVQIAPFFSESACCGAHYVLRTPHRKTPFTGERCLRYFGSSRLTYPTTAWPPALESTGQSLGTTVTQQAGPRHLCCVAQTPRHATAGRPSLARE